MEVGGNQARARGDFCRFLAACYYEPGPEFSEEHLFDSMHAAAVLIDPELAAAAQGLGEAFCAETPENLLIDYTRLFLGPVEIRAKPYGSVWLGGENALMQDSTMAVLDLYEQGGFEMDENFHELPDHVAAELEFLYLLICRETEARGNGEAEALQAASSLKRRFLEEHLGRWVGPFTAAVKTHAQSAFYRRLAEVTGYFVGAEAKDCGAA